MSSEILLTSPPRGGSPLTDKETVLSSPHVKFASTPERKKSIRIISPHLKSPFKYNPRRTGIASEGNTLNIKASILNGRAIQRIRKAADLLIAFKDGIFSKKHLDKRLPSEARFRKTLARLKQYQKHIYQKTLSLPQQRRVYRYIRIAEACLKYGWHKENYSEIRRKELPKSIREFANL